MKLNLPLVGQVKTGKDADTVEVIKEVEKALDILGGFFEFGSHKLSGETTVSTRLLAANTGWVYRNNDVIAQEVSKVDFQLFTIGLNNGEIVYNEVVSHPLLDLLDKANDETTKSDLFYVVQSHKKLSGDAFLLKVRNNSQVVALRVLAPDKIKLNLRNPTPNDPTVIESYEYKDTIKGQTVEITYNPRDIIHFKKPNPNNQFRGLGAVEALADTIDLDNLTTETTKKFFQNGAITNFILSTESKITDDQLKRLEAQLRATHGGAKNAYKAMILGGGLKPENISYSNRDLEFLGQLEWYRDKIMVGFGNTKASMGMVDDVNRASFEGSYSGWLKSTVKPDMAAIVNTLNEFLVPEFGGGNLVLGFKDPVPDDRTDDVDEAEKLYKARLITRNEGREMIELEAVEGGDEFETAPAPIIPGGSNEEDT